MKANPKIAPPGWEISQLLKMLQDRESACQAPRETATTGFPAGKAIAATGHNWEQKQEMGNFLEKFPKGALNQETETGTKKILPGPFRLWIPREEAPLVAGALAATQEHCTPGQVSSCLGSWLWRWNLWRLCPCALKVDFTRESKDPDILQRWASPQEERMWINSQTSTHRIPKFSWTKPQLLESLV